MEPAHSLLGKNNDVPGAAKWEKEGTVWNNELIWLEKKQMRFQVRGFLNRGNKLQGKPSSGFSIQIKLRRFLLNASWKPSLPSALSCVWFQTGLSHPASFCRQHLRLLRWVSGQQFPNFARGILLVFGFFCNSLLQPAWVPGYLHNAPVHSNATHIWSSIYYPNYYTHKTGYLLRQIGFGPWKIKVSSLEKENF